MVVTNVSYHTFTLAQDSVDPYIIENCKKTPFCIFRTTFKSFVIVLTCNKKKMTPVLSKGTAFCSLILWIPCLEGILLSSLMLLAAL